MPNKGVPRPRWTQEDEEIIWKYFPDIDACVEEFKRIERQRSKDSVTRKAQSLGLYKRGKRESWSRTEKAILTEYYPDGGSTEVKEQLATLGFERSESAIYSHASDIDVKCDGRGVEGRWTQEEIDLLTELYDGHTPTEIMNEFARRGFNRTINAINARGRILNLHKTYVRRKEREGKIKTINFVVDTNLDADVIERLNQYHNRSKYIRSLVREDIAKEKYKK